MLEKWVKIEALGFGILIRAELMDLNHSCQVILNAIALVDEVLFEREKVAQKMA
jgi:hypothetical protein